MSITDFSAAEDISVPDEVSLHVKTVRTKPREVKPMHANLTMEIIAKYQSVILSANYMFVNGVLLFNTYIHDINSITSRQQDPNTDITMPTMKSIKAYYEKRGFKIVELRESEI